MKQFETGKTYSMTSVCDSECVWTYTVTKRTASTVTLVSDDGETKTCRINKRLSAWDNRETVLPLGQYSMAPILRA